MKRITILILSLIFLIACVPTPEEDFVVNKAEGALEAAIAETTPVPVYRNEDAETPQKRMLGEALGAPEHVSERFSGTVFGGTLEVTVDAQTEIPDVSAVPVYTVRDRSFTAEEKAQIAKLLLGDAPYYERNRDKMKKDRLKRNIDALAAFLSALDEHAYGADFPYDERRQAAQDYWQDDLEQYSALPEPAPMEAWNGSFSDEPAVLADETNRGMRINSNQVLLYSPFGDAPEAIGGKRAPQNEAEQSAAQSALRVMEALDNGMYQAYGVFGENELFNTGWHGNVTLENTAYTVCLAPLIAGIPCYPYAVDHGSDTALQAAGVTYDEAYDALIRPATVQMLVEDGAVTALEWSDVFTVERTENENVALKPFDEILNIFRRQILYSYYLDPPEQGKENVCCMEIERIELSYMRVKKKDGNGESFLLPVWDFIGFCYDADRPQDRETIAAQSWYLEQSLLTVNAIDGSVIDRRVGY